MERERKLIEADNRARRRFLRANDVKEDTSSLPLPTLLKAELKHGKKPIFDLMDAIGEIKGNSKAKFDETLDAHVRLGTEKGRFELKVCGTLALPHSVKKDVKVAFFAKVPDAEDARVAGADVIGGVELIEEYVKMYTNDGLMGGYVIMLGAYPLSQAAALEELHAYASTL